MLLEFEHWRCSACGDRVDDVPEDARPTSEIRAAGGRPSVRIVFVDRNEVHRCEVGPYRAA